MRMHSLTAGLTVALMFALLIGCSAEADVSIPADQVILQTEVVRYADLSASERAVLGSSCCTYTRTGGWMISDLQEFGPEEAYYVRAVIDPTALAQLSLLHSCGSVAYVETCSVDELNQKVAEKVGDLNSRMLYGKYMNRWVFLDETGEIRSTEKFEGFRLLTIERTGNPIRDHVVIGPIPKRPTRMRILLANNVGEPNRALSNPEVLLANP